MRTSYSSQHWSAIRFGGLLASIARSAPSLIIISPVLIGYDTRQLCKGPVSPSCSALRVQSLRCTHGPCVIPGMSHRLVAPQGTGRYEAMSMIVTMNVIRLVHRLDMVATGVRLVGGDMAVEDRTAAAEESTITIRDDSPSAYS